MHATDLMRFVITISGPRSVVVKEVTCRTKDKAQRLSLQYIDDTYVPLVPLAGTTGHMNALAWSS